MIYAVNAKKEHRIINVLRPSVDILHPSWGLVKLVQADADGWIEWNGGECPLPKHKKCEHIMRCTPNSDMFHTELAGHLRWTHENLSGDIIAYRPIIDQLASEEPKGWCGDGLPHVGEKILVRKNDNDWLTVEVVAHDDGGIIYRDPSATDHKYKWAIGGGIRPLPTHRDQWVDSCVARLVDYYGNPKGAESYIGVASMLHDALASGELPTPEKTQ